MRATLSGLVAVPPRPLSGIVDGLRTRQIARQLRPHDPPLLRALPQGFSDILVLRWDGEAGRTLVVKHARCDRAVPALARESDVLRRLAGDGRLPGWHRMLPTTVEARLDARLPVVLQSLVPGTSAETLLRRNPQDAGRITRVSLAAVTELHRATGRMEDAGDRIDGWVAPRLAVLADHVRWCRTGAGAAGLAAVQHRLHQGLTHRQTWVAWTHGDFAPGNVLMNEDGDRVTGMVDWADADPDGPSEVDRCTFALALGWLLDGRTMGEQVVDAVRTGSLRVEEVGGDQPSDIVLLTWLWHVAANFEKSRQYSRNRQWVRANVVSVLEEAARWS